MGGDKSSQESSDQSPWFRVGQLVGVIALSFVLGSLVTHKKWAPYEEFLRPAFLALRAQLIQMRLRQQVDGQVKRASDPVKKHLESKAFDGFTYYSSGHAPGAYLVDMKGKEVHRWHVDYSAVFGPHAEVDDARVEWRQTHMFENGDLLVVLTCELATPYGLGLMKLDKNSKVIWKSDDHFHHDLDVLPDGTVIALSQKMRDTRKSPIVGHPDLPQFVLDDIVVYLDTDGNERRRFSVLDAVARSKFSQALDVIPTESELGHAETWDPIHTNNIEVLGDAFAAHHDFLDPDDLLLSFRTLDTVAVLDPDSEEIVFGMRGFWRRQHDPDPLPNGNILLFDNLGAAGENGFSRILEVEPITGAIAWSYPRHDDERFFSEVGAQQQQLPNGNVLITAYMMGTVLEVTRSGELAWLYRNPDHLQRGERTMRAIMSGAKRVPRTYVQFDLGTDDG